MIYLIRFCKWDYVLLFITYLLKYISENNNSTHNKNKMKKGDKPAVFDPNSHIDSEYHQVKIVSFLKLYADSQSSGS